jgi:hypothetical protein
VTSTAFVDEKKREGKTQGKCKIKEISQVVYLERMLTEIYG